MLTLNKNEVMELKGNFFITNKDENEIDTPLEKIRISDIGDKKRQIVRKLVNGEETRHTVISSKYYPYASSEFFKQFLEQEWAEDVLPTLSSVNFRKSGIVEILFGNHVSDLKSLNVLDSGRGTNYLERYKKPKVEDFVLDFDKFGDYRRMILLMNSYNKSIAIDVMVGALRLVCSNGLIAGAANFRFDKRYRHFIGNKEQINYNVSNILNKSKDTILQLDYIERMKQVGIDDNLKKKFKLQINKWIAEKLDSESVQKSHTFKNAYMFFREFLPKTLDKANNYLDFENTMSFFRNNERFDTGMNFLSSTITNRFNRIINN